MPNDPVSVIVGFLKPKEIISLINTSRHFFGRTPEVLIPQSAVNYGIEACDTFCDAAYEFNEATAKCSERRKCPCSCVLELILVPFTVVTCMGSVPACFLGCVVGSVVDVKTLLKLAVRPEDPDEGYMVINRPPKPPSIQRMR